MTMLLRQTLLRPGSTLVILIVACTDAVAPNPVAPNPVGVWGGAHVRLEIVNLPTSGVPSGGPVEFDCAHGSINASVTTDNSGRFDAPGVYIQEHGGPIREGEQVIVHPARYSGQISGNRMTLTVTRTDSAWSAGPFTLDRGVAGSVFKCL
ncbi:MAG: hypothetical protein NTX19_07720 [Gemmatimonadetes bacterium]|nr:hypothetical protein [Gemmatimonadota bacterium]